MFADRAGRDSVAEPREVSLSKMPPGRNYLLVQNAHDANSVRPQPVKHDMPSLLVPV
jgi:hypothetical protein